MNKKRSIEEIKKAFESKPIDYTDSAKLAEDCWMFLVPNKKLPQAVITKEAFLHEVGAMIESAILFNAKPNQPSQESDRDNSKVK